MTSKKQIAANRRNAARSTGPRTIEGKIASAANALRHGLAAGSARDPYRSEEIQKLFRALKAKYPSREVNALLLDFAEAETDVLRARRTWFRFFETVANDNRTYRQLGAARNALRYLAAAARRDEYVPDWIGDAIKNWVNLQIPPEEDRVRTIFKVAGGKLAKIFRYEDHALGRRRMILQRLQRIASSKK